MPPPPLLRPLLQTEHGMASWENLESSLEPSGGEKRGYDCEVM